MKTVGIVAEYNPFHKGHEHQIRWAKQVLKADAVLVVMSGPFVQRGEPALTDKASRARAALAHGADLVAELPPAYALGGAEVFARGAVGLMEASDCVDELLFGAACADTGRLERLAELAEDDGTDLRLRKKLREGLSYPAAMTAALQEADPDAGILLADPNTLLGLEYIRALRKQNSRIRPRAMLRAGSAYNETELPEEGTASASALRQALREGRKPADLAAFCPPVMLEACGTCLFPDDLSAVLSAALLRLSAGGKEALIPFADVNEALAARILEAAPFAEHFTQLTERIRTRAFTAARVRRALMHLLLEIRKEDQAGLPASIKILGLRKDSALPGLLRETARIPLITKTADADPALVKAFAPAQSLYVQCVYFKYGKKPADDYRQSPIVL